MHQFVRVEFNRFKAFKSFGLDLRHFNILVGPNNAGKSTILAAFRILAAALRRAGSRKATLVRGPQGRVLGYEVELALISVAEENIFFDYIDDEPASVTFRLSNRNSLTLYFPESGVCYLIPDADGRTFSSPSTFKNHFDCPIGFVPILGPVEHHEPLYEPEAARLALFNYRAARNFRNIWYHYPEKFSEFREALAQTWPGMDILPPEVDRSYDRPRLHMFCPEKRIPRELFWSGFGFQVWCQMLTHLIQSSNSSIFLIDEPDIYLHSELQRQLLTLLRGLGPDILIATHSTEIITEAEADEILLINKSYKSARRIHYPGQLGDVFKAVGSNINPILTQLAKTRRAVFVEGKDFQVVSKFARKLNRLGVGNRREFAVVPVEGFNPERIRNLKLGMEATLGTRIAAASILDRDYRSAAECKDIVRGCSEFCDLVVVHGRKEIENFLLVPAAIDRALAARLAERTRRLEEAAEFTACAEDALWTFADANKSYVLSQMLAEERRFHRSHAPSVHEADVSQKAIEQFEVRWAKPLERLNMIPGKDALSAVNKHAQEAYSVSVTPMAIIDAMMSDEIPDEMRGLVEKLVEFSISSPGAL